MSRSARQQITASTPYDALPEWLSIREAAAYLGCSKWLVYQSIDRLDAHGELRTLQELLNALHTQFEMKLNALGRPRDRALQHEQDVLRRALSQLNDGVKGSDGVELSALTPLIGKPGLQQAPLIVARLRRERDKLQAHLQRWPTLETTHKYRYTGPRFKATLRDRDLEPGDVVELNQEQAQVWGDRFEAVAEPKPAPASVS